MMYLDTVIDFSSSFPAIFDFIKNGVFSIFDVMRHTYLFGNFSLLSFLIVAMVFDLIFATFFVTFNIRNNNTTRGCNDKKPDNNKGDKS